MENFGKIFLIALLYFTQFSTGEARETDDDKVLGIFTFNFVKFMNPTGEMTDGGCCNAEPLPAGCPIDVPCKTRFLIALRPSQGARPWDNILYGTHLTGVVGQQRNISVNLTNEFHVKQFSWSVHFQIKVIAFHDQYDNQTFQLSDEGNKHTIFSTTIQGSLTPKDGWTSVTRSPPQEGVAGVTWKAKFECVNNNYGDTCQTNCVPRDGVSGHFTCDYDGNKVCMEGWKNPVNGSPCTQVACSQGCVEDNAFCTTAGSCTYKPGWTGVNCDVCVKKSGCLQGHCEGHPYQCRCSPGWSGELCNIDDNYCETNSPCANGGTCKSGVDIGRNYTCLCKDGYSGNNCQVFEPCSLKPCKNDGVCEKIDNNYHCNCTSGYEGVNCESAVCTCENGGTCRENSTVCDCPQGFSGEKCDQIFQTVSGPTIKCNDSGSCGGKSKCNSDGNCVKIEESLAPRSTSYFLAPGQVALVSIVCLLLVMAVVITVLIIHQRKREEQANDVGESTKEENLALNEDDPESGSGIHIKSRTASHAAVSTQA